MGLITATCFPRRSFGRPHSRLTCKFPHDTGIAIRVYGDRLTQLAGHARLLTTEFVADPRAASQITSVAINLSMIAQSLAPGAVLST